MIELTEHADGLWQWRYVEGDRSFWSSKSYSSAKEALSSAMRAYPDAKVKVPGEHDADKVVDLLEASEGYPRRPSTVQRSAAQEKPPSKLLSLVVLGLAYLRTRASGRERRK